MGVVVITDAHGPVAARGAGPTTGLGVGLGRGVDGPGEPHPARAATSSHTEAPVGVLPIRIARVPPLPEARHRTSSDPALFSAAGRSVSPVGGRLSSTGHRQSRNPAGPSFPLRDE